MPLYIHLIRDDTLNKGMVGESACAGLDLEMFWSGETKFPNEDNNQGSCDSFHQHPQFKTMKMYQVVEPFEAK